MKRFVMQLMRTLVTVIVVGTLAAMVFSLRGEVAALKARLARQTIARPCEPGLFETIAGRTSVRKFDPTRLVSDADVEKILRAAMCAPSAMNKQPWAFVVVRDEAKLKALAEAIPSSRIGNGAKLAICVCGSLDNGLPGRGKEFWIHDCSAASMNILLAVKALGLGAVWTAGYPDETRVASIRKVLGVPDGYMPLNLIPIGYPAEQPEPKDKWDAAKVHADSW